VLAVINIVVCKQKAKKSYQKRKIHSLFDVHAHQVFNLGASMSMLIQETSWFWTNTLTEQPRLGLADYRQVS